MKNEFSIPEMRTSTDFIALETRLKWKGQTAAQLLSMQIVYIFVLRNVVLLGNVSSEHTVVFSTRGRLPMSDCIVIARLIFY